MTRDSGNGSLDNSRQDIFLLLSLLLLILLHPVLAEGRLPRLLLGVLTFVPLIVATVRMSRRKGLAWALVLLIAGAVLSAVGAFVSGSQTLLAIQWAIMTVAFGLAVVGMFSYLQQASSVSAGHLFTAASIYLLLVLLFFALYTTITAIQPGAFLKTGGEATQHSVDLLYFSLVTLTTVGYGDIVPIGGEVRLIAGLEAATGVLYVAITVALLVSAYQAKGRQ